MHHLSILLVIAYIGFAILWDLTAAILGLEKTASWCSAARAVNRATNGLLALGSIALWIHVFLLPYLPSFWRR